MQSLLNITPIKCKILQVLVYIFILKLGFHFRLDFILDFGNFVSSPDLLTFLLVVNGWKELFLFYYRYKSLHAFYLFIYLFYFGFYLSKIVFFSSQPSSNLRSI